MTALTGTRTSAPPAGQCPEAPARLPVSGSRHFELALALQQAALAAAVRAGGRVGEAVTGLGSLPGWPVSPSRVFRGTAREVAGVRAYARAGFAGHDAAADAVLVVSELAANSVEHSASGKPGGIFMVHLAVISPHAVAVIVTDQGGPGQPARRDAGPDGEAGRGLAVVHALSSLVQYTADAGLRSVLAVIPAPPGAVGDQAGSDDRP